MAAQRDAQGKFIKGSGSGGKGSPGGLVKRLNLVAELHGTGIAAGFPGTAAAPGEASGSDLVAIASAHEFGIGVPERPFMRGATAAHQQQWAAGALQAARQTAQGDQAGAEQTARLLGVTMVSDVQRSLESGQWEPLADETIERKGSDLMLVDTGQMKQSVRAVRTSPDGSTELIG